MALCLAASSFNASAQQATQLSDAQKQEIQQKVLPVVFEQIKEQAGIDILGWAQPKLTADYLGSLPGFSGLKSSNGLRADETPTAYSVKPDSIILNLGGSLTGGALNKNYGVLSRDEQIRSLKRNYEELNSKVKKAKDDYLKMKNKLSDSQKVFDGLNDDNKKIKLDYYNSDHEYQKVVIELSSLRDQHTKLAQERKDVIRKIENLNVIINDSKNEIKNVEGKIKIIEESLNAIDSNKNDSIAKKKKLDEKFSALQMDVLSTNKDIETLSYEINSIIENKKLKEEQNSKLLAELESISLKNVKIAVDAGHGGNEIGAIGCLRNNEKDVNLAIARNLASELKLRGARVVMTRNGDETVGLYDRVKKTNENEAMVFISIHGNALPDNMDPNEHKGTSVFYYYPQAKPLADSILKSMTAQLPLSDDGVRLGSFAVVRNTDALSVLVEVGYLINPSDNAYLLYKEIQANAAKAIADGLEVFLKN